MDRDSHTINSFIRGCVVNKNVLIVEDDPDLLRMECMLLSTRGFEVTGVDDGEKALAHMSKSKPDLVLLDVMMPGIDGFEVCKIIKSDESNCHIPVIMLTARSSNRNNFV